jgi:ATP-dependent Clp protease ATP-binding subunit ClpB
MSRIQLLDPNKKGREAEALEIRLRQLVIGQDEAIGKIVEAYQGFRTGMSPAGRPVGNFLFLGPTGSGKTRVVEATAEALLNDAGGVIKIDCAEFQHSHEIAKLVGSPPGYLGHRETHALLSQEALNRHHTEELKLGFVLFDEIEKASDSLWNLLLGILDKGTLTLGDNRRVDFSQSIIFMTSNLGAAEMSALSAPRLGFHVADSSDEAGKAELNGKVTAAGVSAARRRFTPEFINRLDHIVVFRSLGMTELRRIVDIELNGVQQRIRAAAGDNRFVLDVTGSAREFLVAQGTDERYGARPLKRAIERLLVHPLSNLMASRQIRRGDRIRVSHLQDARSLLFSREAQVEQAWGVASQAA